MQVRKSQRVPKKGQNCKIGWIGLRENRGLEAIRVVEYRTADRFCELYQGARLKS
jgi:hypothetical protein